MLLRFICLMEWNRRGEASLQIRRGNRNDLTDELCRLQKNRCLCMSSFIAQKRRKRTGKLVGTWDNPW